MPESYRNPIAGSGADPWVIRHGGSYFWCGSAGGGIFVAEAERLQDIGMTPKTVVWSPPPGTSYSKEIWAPELHLLHDKWYIYFAADDGQNENHRMYVLEGLGPKPSDGFLFKGKINDCSDKWAIDGTVLSVGDSLYFVWSGWEGDVNVQQNLYIARMPNPWTIKGPRVLISQPEYGWERIGQPYVNEGPEVLMHDGLIHIIYSASGSWTDDYCLGRLTCVGGDVMDPGSWIKNNSPVFSRTDKVFGPGHASFVKSPDGTEDWIVYHAAKHSGAGWNRDVRMQKFHWSPDGSPVFGRPIDPGVETTAPSGTPDPRGR